MIKFPKKIMVIECEDINLTEQDIIQVSHQKDFKKIVDKYVFKLGKVYYSFCDSSVITYFDGGER
jgi:hypothetical protein